MLGYLVFVEIAERLRDRATPIGVVLMSEAASIAHAAAAIRLGLPNVLVRPRDPGLFNDGTELENLLGWTQE